jgi:hypothetical protein
MQNSYCDHRDFDSVNLLLNWHKLFCNLRDLTFPLCIFQCREAIIYNGFDSRCWLMTLMWQESLNAPPKFVSLLRIPPTGNVDRMVWEIPSGMETIYKDSLTLHNFRIDESWVDITARIYIYMIQTLFNHASLNNRYRRLISMYEGREIYN